MVRKANPKVNWKRVPNTGKGRTVGNKYNFSEYLKKVGDFVETYAMSRLDCDRITLAAHIWAYRKHCRITTSRIYLIEGDAVRITVISHTRKERK